VHGSYQAEFLPAEMMCSPYGSVDILTFYLRVLQLRHGQSPRSDEQSTCSPHAQADIHTCISGLSDERHFSSKKQRETQKLRKRTHRIKAPL
jgi:hypothetical protein